VTETAAGGTSALSATELTATIRPGASPHARPSMLTSPGWRAGTGSCLRPLQWHSSHFPMKDTIVAALVDLSRAENTQNPGSGWFSAGQQYRSPSNSHRILFCRFCNRITSALHKINYQR
jgi:hypothetical protein